MDDFTIYRSSFDACLDSLDRVLNRYIETNLVLNFEKCHFMVEQGIVLGHRGRSYKDNYFFTIALHFLRVRG